MPLRRWFARAGFKHPVAYSLATFALGMVVCMTIAVVISVQASNRAIRDSERRSCNALRAELGAYAETPPTAPAGINIMNAKREQYRIQHCPEGNTP
jgi:hypothetical protein